MSCLYLQIPFNQPSASWQWAFSNMHCSFFLWYIFFKKMLFHHIQKIVAVKLQQIYFCKSRFCLSHFGSLELKCFIWKTVEMGDHSFHWNGLLCDNADEEERCKRVWLTYWLKVFIQVIWLLRFIRGQLDCPSWMFCD